MLLYSTANTQDESENFTVFQSELNTAQPADRFWPMGFANLAKGINDIDQILSLVIPAIMHPKENQLFVI